MINPIKGVVEGYKIKYFYGIVQVYSGIPKFFNRLN